MDPDERFDLIVDSVIDFEGGHSLNPNDRGNWTGGKVGSGILRGTKYGISAASYPDLDIANLTIPDAKGIYYRDYWLEGECNLMPGAMAALHFDAIVQHGLFYANEFLRDSGGDPWIYYAERLSFYANLENFYQEDDNPYNDYGRGWVNRMAKVAHLMVAMRDAPDGLPQGWKLVVEGAPGGAPTIFDLATEHDVVSRVSPERRRIYVSVKE